MTARGNYCIPVAEAVWARTPREFPEKKSQGKCGACSRNRIYESVSQTLVPINIDRQKFMRNWKMSTMYSIEHIRSINLFLFYFLKNYSYYLYNTLLLFQNAISIKKNYPRIFETIHVQVTNSSWSSRKATLLLFNINRNDDCILLKNLDVDVNDKKSAGWQFEGWKKFKHEHEKWKMEVVRKAHHHLIV